jgi:hypothetical protein
MRMPISWTLLANEALTLGNSEMYWRIANISRPMYIFESFD